MSLGSLLAFTVVLILTYASPGPDFAIILRYATHSQHLGRWAAMGVLSGMCVHLTAAIAGLSTVLTTSAAAFTVIKILGAGYLLFLGLQGLLTTSTSDHPKSSHSLPGESARSPARQVFLRGILTNVLNPKTALFFLALIPQFLATPAATTHLQTLGLLTVGFGALWWAGFLVLVDRVRGLLSHPKPRRILDRLTGIALVALGLRLLRTPPTAAP